VICKTGALLLLFIEFGHLGIKCFNSTIYGVKTCCPLQVERWLLQLNFPIGSCGALWCKQAQANHTPAYRETRLDHFSSISQILPVGGVRLWPGVELPFNNVINLTFFFFLLWTEQQNIYNTKIIVSAKLFEQVIFLVKKWSGPFFLMWHIQVKARCDTYVTTTFSILVLYKFVQDMFQNQVKCNLGYVIKTLELLHGLKHTFNYKNKCFFFF